MRRVAPNLLSSSLLLAILGTVGCNESPSDGFNAFLEASYAGDNEAALARFDSTTRSRLVELHAMGATGGQSPAQYLRDNFAPISVEKIDVISQTENKARLRIVSETGDEETVEMVLEGEKWRIVPMR